MVKFYVMGDGFLIAVAGRGTNKKAIRILQETWWAKKHGGICDIITYTEPRAVFFATHQK